MADQKDDPINPKHYQSHPSGIQCIEIVEHFPYNLGAAVKYIWRCQHSGKEVQDIQKAIWYLQRQLEKIEADAKNTHAEKVVKEMKS